MEQTFFNKMHTWLWQRITAFFLFIGLGVHFFVVHFAIERPISFSKVTERLSHPLWIFFDLLLLLAATYHSLNGLWNIYIDYNPRVIFRKIIGWILFVLGIVIVIFGTFILIPFR